MQQKWRLYVIELVLCVAVGGLLWRLVDLTIVERPFLLRQSKARILRKIQIPAYRGMIIDRLGDPLAVSTPVDSVWINPKIFSTTPKQLACLSSLLNQPKAYILKQAKHNTAREFVYLKRGLPPPLAKKIRMLDIKGLYFQREYRRYYPEAAVTAHVVGLTNIDDQGQEGLELAYNQWLAGQPGRKEILKDRLGRIIADVTVLKKPVQGKNLQLSIDHRIQYLAYNSLRTAVNKYHAKAGSAVVLDVKTGEILAMVNQPSYNPNRRPKVRDGRYRNRAVTDVFELGSVMKPFTIAFALESGQYTAQTMINTNHGWMTIGGYRIKDDLDYGTVTLTQLLQKSSNIAAAKILLSLSPQHYWQLLRELGFGQRTHSGFPGEADGSLVTHATWAPSVVATLAYGYGISVTTLQLAHAFAILANHGDKVPVTFLKSTKRVESQSVLPREVADTVITMLETVVQKGGTGTRARVPGYYVAGKTGTAYIADAGGYAKHRYMASFVGVAPANNPRLVVAVIVKEPQGQHFGGLVAAPTFAKIMAGSLRLLDVMPDDVSFMNKDKNDGIATL